MQLTCSVYEKWEKNKIPHIETDYTEEPEIQVDRVLCPMNTLAA